MRRDRYFIGRDERNPLADDISQAVAYLSEELYAKDVQFLMELIQNAEDNEYPAGLSPSLELVLTTRDITGAGAPATLLLFNNERGFSPANIASICRVGKSTKKAIRHRGYIGEKGIGFKSVFLISKTPYIFSNGYQIRFNEEASPDCGIAYIVPEWIEDHPSLTDIHQVYGSSKPLPTTVLVLPLKSEKVAAVKNQLSSMHPELLLFLSKIRQLSVREDNDDSRLSTISQISISSELDFQMRKNVSAESYTLHLCANEIGQEEEEECRYYMWKQRFPVNLANREKKRMEVEEWVITLAFPYGERLNGRSGRPGVFSFLPTEMLTNFPFVIQADFLLASSRESILVDSKWNKGILGCVHIAFLNAFDSLLKSAESAPLFSLPPMFKFLPVFNSSIPILDSVRTAIKEKVPELDIMPCESHSEQKIFRKPGEVRRLIPAFWDILVEARKDGINFLDLNSHGCYILCSAFDNEDYDEVLGFLDLKFVDNEWYAKCIESSNLAKELSEERYMKLLCFIADNWANFFSKTNMKNISLIRYVDSSGEVSFWSISRAVKYSERIALASDMRCVRWLIDWNKEFSSAAKLVMFPVQTQEALDSCPSKGTIKNWLINSVDIRILSVHDYAVILLRGMGERKLVIAFTHFLYHSLLQSYISEWQDSELCRSTPVVDNYGGVAMYRSCVLVPAKGSSWIRLMDSNPWRNASYVELSSDYLSASSHAGIYTPPNVLLDFLNARFGASDIPYVTPANAPFPTVASPLIKDNALLLLEWVRTLMRRGTCLPEKFLHSLKHGSWLKTSIGYKPPSESFLSTSDWGSLLNMGSALVDIPLIDQSFYNYSIGAYKHELQTIGVMFEFGEASGFIGRRLMSMAASSNLTKSNVFALLQLIRFMREKSLSPEHLIKSVKGERWLKTTQGFRYADESILFTSEWETALQICELPFIDADYYGKDINSYKTELGLLGVESAFNANYQLLVDNFKMYRFLISLRADTTLLVLQCIRSSKSPTQLLSKLGQNKWLKTRLGFRPPCESILVEPEWQCLVDLVDDVATIDLQFYGGHIQLYRKELKDAGVTVELQEAAKIVSDRFKKLASSASLKKKHVFAVLNCVRLFAKAHISIPAALANCLRNEKWLRTTLNSSRCPKETILRNPDWESISQIASLPFLDDSDAFYGKEIYDYKEEFKALGVTFDFEFGSRFVISGIKIPRNPDEVTPSNVLSLLQCIRNSRNIVAAGLDEDFMNFISGINKKWLKTSIGYMAPCESILFDSKWNSFLQKEDGPFINEAYYGSEILKFKAELNLIGVTVDISCGCSHLARHIKRHSSIDAITRVYSYLREHNWQPSDDTSDWIWIPNGSDAGEWVNYCHCVVQDKEDLFSSQLHILERYYNKTLFSFFSSVLRVKHSPAFDDYCKLWKTWESERKLITQKECSAVWVFIAKHWNSITETLLKNAIEKLPVSTESGIVLCSKRDVFIADDLLLKDLFDVASETSIFLWYPQASIPALSRAKMNDMYRSIGVRNISEAVAMDDSFSPHKLNLRRSVPSDITTRRGLFMIILGFLGDPSLDICSETRHQIAKHLAGLEIWETDEPIGVRHSLKLSSEKTLAVEASRMVRWEKESSKLFVQTFSDASDNKGRIEFASHFSNAISEGLLFEMTDQISALSELIKLGWLLDFEETAIDYLLKTKNLQLFQEDEEFLASICPLENKV